MAGPVRRIVVVVGAYLLVSFPPYLYLNWDVVADRSFVLLLAAGGTGLVVLLAGVFLLSDGLTRYGALLVGRTDPLTFIVKVTFLLAAASWWLVPEIVFLFDLQVGLPMVFTVIAIAHLPVMLFVSLTTIVGESQRRQY